MVECERHFAEILIFEEARGKLDPTDPARDARGFLEQPLETQPALLVEDAASDEFERLCESVEGDVVECLTGET